MMCTYLNESEYEKYSSVADKELNELLQEVREKFDGKYYIQTNKHIQKRIFRKPKEYISYTLYGCLGKPEVQIFNFPKDSGSGIGECTGRAQIMTLFYGLLNGMKHEQQKQENAESNI